jgi:hypothetical protein
VLIQVLCVPDCRNCKPTIDRVRQVLGSEGVDARVEEVLVGEETAARSLRFPGSPTVRVNGVDVEPSGQSAFGLTCRLYADGTGLPAEQALRRAISAAREQR